MTLIPSEASKPSSNFTSMLIMALPKIGKTQMLLDLPNSLHIDYQRGAESFGGVSVNMLSELEKLKQAHIASGSDDDPPTLLTVLREIAIELREKKAKGEQYDFIILDPLTEFQRTALLLAEQKYYASNLPDKIKNITDIRMDLEWGKGYTFLELASIQIIEEFLTFPKHCLILVGHPKNQVVIKEGKEITVDDLDLENKVKGYIVQNVPVIGSLTRRRNNENWLSFKRGDNALYYGARPDHLHEKEFLISKMVDGKLETYWDQIFPFITKPKPKSK